MRIGVKSSRSLLPLGGMVEQVEIVRVYAVRIVEGSGQVRFDHVFWSGNKRSPRSVATAPTVRKTRDPFFPSHPLSLGCHCHNTVVPVKCYLS